MKVFFSAAAEQALEQIGDYIAQDRPLRAISFVRELTEKALELALTPRAVPVVPRYAARGVRRRVHSPYLIFYRIEADAVVILHILHGAQDIDRVLFPDEPEPPA